ncbi:acyltransferase family protein [Tindallia californiensis]|uniref:Membrane-bound acyltransferase YfiQ, involved in biofilm formation n=1 Tax=Tindallia californiensis TaxID=159292 RepID=A0A1H3RCZ3_9FIRM|nr:acyltransferase family protein [Tindallia californiensis]SDZ23702.1 Membrane-bound acyltransferase YfiQ, involved in biofilm formation [Tindallia californiensis]
MAKKRIYELHFIRSIACLCVVFVHSMTRVVEIHASELTDNQVLWLMTLRLFFTFGTPIFIFLSEFLISYSYADGIPEGFLKKRAQYILLPYLSMSVVYAFIMVHESSETLISNGLISSFSVYVLQNLLFGFYNHGYFIIVIFQFYLLHIWLRRFLERQQPGLVIAVSLAINLVYLSYFNMTPPPEIPFGEYLWRGLHWVPFPSWIFYFTLGYYGGRHYDVLKEKVLNLGVKIHLVPVLAAIPVITFYLRGIIVEDSSRRVDILFLTTAMIFLLFRMSFRMKKIPEIFNGLNHSSFGIYLLHMVFLYLMTLLFETYRILAYHPLLTLLVMFVGSVTLSVLATELISRLSFGYVIIGKKPEYQWMWSRAKKKCPI